MGRVDAATRAQVASRVRDDGWCQQSVQTLAAIRRLYAAQVSPTATEHGYWHVHVRRGFRIPYFTEPAVKDFALRPDGDAFCAVYYSLKDRQVSGSTSSGLPMALFRGSYSEEHHEAIEHTFRLLTDEVLEPARWKWNAERGRLFGRVTGWILGVLVVAGAAACLLRMPSPPPAMSWLMELPPIQRWGVGGAGVLLALGMAGALVSEVLAGVIGGAGGAAERWRLRALDPAAATFRYNADAAEGILREYAVVVQEEQKLNEYERLRAGGAELGRDDFMRVYPLLPQVRQLAALERRRRDDALALQRKLGDDFPLPAMKLVDACLPPAAPGAAAAATAAPGNARPSSPGIQHPDGGAHI